MASEGRAGLLTDDRHDRLVVELGVVEAVQEMDRSRPRRRQAHADLIRPLGVRAGHQGGRLLVADLDELDALLGALQGAHDPVDAIAGIAVDAVDAPLGEPLNEEIGDVHAKISSLVVRLLVPCPVTA